MDKRVSLVHLEIGKIGKIVEIQGGPEKRLKLENMGIRIGEEIKKISQQGMHGPVVVEVGRTQVALGSGMATNILLVEVTEGAVNENSSNGKP